MQLWTSCLQKDIVELQKGADDKWDGAEACPVRLQRLGGLRLERERLR